MAAITLLKRLIVSKLNLDSKLIHRGIGFELFIE